MGSSGNISVKLGDGWLMTPANASPGRPDPGALPKLDPEGRYISGDKPVKETFLHIAMPSYRHV